MKDAYFSNLNYTLANEDTWLEVEMIRRLKPKNVLSVCGSGGRSLPLAIAGAENLVCVDLAKEQLDLAKLRRACYLKLTRDDYLRFWGFPPFTPEEGREERKKVFESLDLEVGTRDYFKRLFEAREWCSPLYDGKWEMTFAKIAKLCQRILGRHSKDMFGAKNLDIQHRYFRKAFPKFRWFAVLAVVGNASFFNALLYRGHFVKKNLPESHFDFYRDAYDRLFSRTLARANFFLQLSFLGRILYQDAIPVEAHEDSYSDIQKFLRGSTKVDFVQADLIETASQSTKPIDFISMSDVPSYFSGDVEKTFLQRVKHALSPGAHVVVRSYLRIPEGMDLKNFKDVSDEFQDLIEKEMTQMYRVQVFRYMGGHSTGSKE